MWVYRTTDYANKRAVWFDFCKGRGGEHPRRVLKDYAGTMVTDDYGAYKAIYASGAIIEAGCMAHARRKLFEAHEINGSKIAGHAVTLIARLYVIERLPTLKNSELTSVLPHNWRPPASSTVPAAVHPTAAA